MKNLLQKIALLSLLLAVCSPVLIGFMSYKFQLKKIKKQVKQELISNTSKAELVAFEFDINSERFQNLNWKHSREFEFNNKMFDIVEADTIENIIHYLCFPDKQETELNAKFNAMLKSRYAQDEPLNNAQKLLANFIKSLYNENPIFLEYFHVEVLKPVYNIYSFSFHSRKGKVPTPPPMVI